MKYPSVKLDCYFIEIIRQKFFLTKIRTCLGVIVDMDVKIIIVMVKITHNHIFSHSKSI